MWIGGFGWARANALILIGIVMFRSRSNAPRLDAAPSGSVSFDCSCPPQAGELLNASNIIPWHVERHAPTRATASASTRYTIASLTAACLPLTTTSAPSCHPASATPCSSPYTKNSCSTLKVTTSNCRNAFNRTRRHWTTTESAYSRDSAQQRGIRRLTNFPRRSFQPQSAS